MHGPGISDPSKIVEREVPENDVRAYKAAGYKVGNLPAELRPIYTEVEAVAQNDGVDVTAKQTKSKK